MPTPTIIGTAKGFPAQFGQHIQNAWSNAQGDKVVVSPAAGNTLVCVVFGLKGMSPFDNVDTGANPAYTPSLGDFAAVPTIGDTSATKTATITNLALTTNVVTITAANQFQVGDSVKLSGLTTSTFLNAQTVTLTAATSTTFAFAFTHADVVSGAETGLATKQSAGNNWVPAAGKVVNGGFDVSNKSVGSLDAEFPNVYIFYALNVAAGTYTVAVDNVYENGTTRPGQLAAGKPIFDGGVDVHVFEFSGVLPVGATDGSTGQMSAANPAVAPTFTTTAAGDLILTAGLMKSGNAFSTFAPVGTTGTVMLASGKCVNSQAHWGIQMQLQTGAGAILPGFTNPLGYEMAIAAVALKHS